MNVFGAAEAADGVLLYFVYWFSWSKKYSLRDVSHVVSTYINDALLLHNSEGFK